MAKWLKVSALTILTLIVVVLLILGGYVIYLCAQYYRIADHQQLEIANAQTELVQTNTNYTISTYNIGFGAYTQDFSFFMDSGTMKDGTKTSGSGSKAKDKQTVIDNTNGSINSVKTGNFDFMLFQEVDTNSTRSYGVNQYTLLNESFTEYSNSFAVNFHSGYLFYPILDPHGASNAGIATYSKYKVDNAERRSFPIDEGFFARFFDLDRCFSVNRLPIENSNKELVLINLHMSAYDEGGVIRAKQLEMLNEILKAESDAGNYVIAGGDFNHDIANSKNLFPTQQEVPVWVAQLQNSDLAENYSLVGATNAPTCRSTDMAYQKGVNYSSVIDGFIVSSNITVVNNYNIDTDFKYSDHNPAVMEFKLN